MGFFDFLKDAHSETQAGKQILSFLGHAGKSVASGTGKIATVPYNETRRLVDTATGNQQAAQSANQQANAGISTALHFPTQARDRAIGTGRNIARIPETIARSLDQAGLDLAGKINPEAGGNASQTGQNTGLRELIYGHEPLQTYQQRAEGVSAKTGLAAPLVVAGTLGGDIAGGPIKSTGHEVLEKGIQDLAKANTPAEIRNIMKGTPPEIVDKLALPLSKTSDPNTIRNLLNQHAAPPTPSMVPTPAVGQDIHQATVPVQGEVIPPNTDPIKNVVEALRGQPAAKDQSPVTGLASLQQRQKDIYSAERSARLAKGQAASQDLTGREALQAQLGAQKGELPRVNADALLEHLRSKVTPDDVQNILTTIQKSPSLSGYEPITAGKAITNLFDEGKLPRPHESRLLEKALGPDFNQALGSAAQDSLTKGQKIKNFATELVGAPRSILAVDPSSAWLRQGAVLGARFPKEFGKAAVESVKYLGSEKKYQAMLQEVADRPTADIHEAWGISKAGPGGIKEEPFQSTIAERIRWLGKIVKGADRGYTGFLTKLRADSTDHIIGNLQDAGIDPRTDISTKAGKDIGRFVNTASGRGNLGALEKDAGALSKALFSPRLWKSRLDLINPVYYAKLDPIARKYALQSAGSFAAIAGTVLGLASLAGADVETDPRSSDFLKIKVGNTRYDILGGLQQNLVLAHRELPGSIFGQKTYIGSGEKKSSQSGRITDLSKGGFGAANRLSILSDFVQNKENPVISTASHILKGTDQTGNKVNPAAEIGKLGIPLGIQDVYQTARDLGSKDVTVPGINAKINVPTPGALLKGAAKASPTNVGVGVGTYGTKEISLSTKQQAYVDSLKNKDQQSATKLFLQTVKTAPIKDDAKAAIVQAMQQGDTNKVVQLAQDFNKKYDTTFNSWFKTNEKYYRQDDNLIKEYRKGYITEKTLNSWDKG